MSKIYKVKQNDIKEIALNAMKNEVDRNQATWNRDLSKGFLNSEILDLSMNQGMMDMYGKIMMDGLFDDIVLQK